MIPLLLITGFCTGQSVTFPFVVTTMRPSIGMVEYADHSQVKRVVTCLHFNVASCYVSLKVKRNEKRDGWSVRSTLLYFFFLFNAFNDNGPNIDRGVASAHSVGLLYCRKFNRKKKTVRFSVTGSLFFSQVRVADLPGLIEGAAANRGLGHAFLKHTEKAKALALVVSNTSQFRDLILDIHS